MKDVVIVGIDGSERKVSLEELQNLKLEDGQKLLVDGVEVSLEQLSIQNGVVVVNQNNAQQANQQVSGNIINDLNKKLAEKNIDVVLNLGNEAKNDIQTFKVDGNDVLFVEAAGTATAAVGETEEADVLETIPENTQFGESDFDFENKA